MGETTELRVRVDAEDADAEEIAELTGQLRRALRELDVDAVAPMPEGQAPPVVSGISSRRQDQLIKVWLNRHAGR